jgi:hypothetical protein
MSFSRRLRRKQQAPQQAQADRGVFDSIAEAESAARAWAQSTGRSPRGLVAWLSRQEQPGRIVASFFTRRRARGLLVQHWDGDGLAEVLSVLDGDDPEDALRVIVVDGEASSHLIPLIEV